MNNRTIFNALTCLLLTFLPNLLSAQGPGLPKGWSDGYVYANGIRLHYYHAVPNLGKPVIVMSHGVSDNGLCWTTLTQKLQADYDIYMVDARGHGLSDPPTPADSSNAMVKDLVDFVNNMNLVNPILIGHSMGASTVMRVGAEHPHLTKAIIMLDPGLKITVSPANAPKPSSTAAPATPSAAVTGNRLSVNMFGTPEVMIAQNNYSYEDLVTTGRRQFPMWSDLDVQYWALSKKQYHGVYTPNKTQGRMPLAVNYNPLPNIQVPALILKADASPEIRKANEEAARVMQNGKLVHIDGAAHNLHHDKLEHTTQVIREFLSKI